MSESRLLSEVEDLHMGLLDRAHPLWQLWFIDGLDSGRVAVVEKLHHALADGIGGVDIAMMLLDPTPTYRRPVADPHPLRKEPSPLALLGSAALAAGEVPLEVGRGMLSTAAHPLKSTAGAARLAAAAGSVLADPLAPRCSLNANVGAHRRYRVIRLSFDSVHDTAHALGGTVNDVVLSAVGAGLDTLFASRHEDLNGRKVHALVPVSLRGEHEHRSLGNRVAAMLVALPAGNLDAEQRFAATKAAAGAARRHQQVALSSAVLNLPEYWPEWMLAASSGLAHHQPVFNLVVTNIPGPPEPLYLMGAKLFEVFPVVPLTRNATISVGILSYDHRLTVGLWADRDRFPDLDVLARGIERGFLATAQPARLQRSARR